MAVLKVYNGTIWVEIPTGVLDAALLGYSPAVLADWLNGLDPGEVDDALDQLAAEKASVIGSNVDNAIIRAHGISGDIQDSPLDLADDGTITGKTLASFTVKASTDQKLLVQGGAGSATGKGGDVELEAGAGGETSGDGGDAVVTGGDPITSGHGGNALVKGGNAIGTNKNGGNCNYTAGNNTGSGTEGAHIFDSKKVGMGVAAPKEQLHVDDAIALSNNAEGSTGRLVRRTSHETHTLAAGATSDTTSISIPSGARLLAVSMNVNTIITTSGGPGNFWSAAFITGSTTTIASGKTASQNTKVDFIVPDEKTTAVTEIRFSADAGNFTGGVIEVVAYYEELTSLADV